ncbi:Sulfite reductase NADPH subunit beta [Hondaea fermentalgiana]|uniref:assimilatory sulfite reductase (NADPH) n=1 Tax=Hondaea fermentalgiana TaxID=2315210 RepID=A0A2R5GVH3_9STRA|nr:Sulfite reductase NADPH subunit beta [Hondaea fermentalgiana]|eukprot:GBG34565.1 Sulfite reductase NADPH subunit beta [Hondaea fermentalgiana]
MGAKDVLVSGGEASAHVAFALSDAVLVQAAVDVPGAQGVGEKVLTNWHKKGKTNATGALTQVRVVERADSTGAELKEEGGRVAVVTGSQMLRKMVGNLYGLGAERLGAGNSLVVHVSAASRTEDGAVFADLSDVMAVRETGFAMLAAANVQEVHDFAVAAHIVSETQGVPVLSFWDGTRLGSGLSHVDLLAADDLADLRSDMADLQGLPSPAHALDAALKRVSRFEKGLFDYQGPADAEAVIVACGTAALSFPGTSVGVLRVRAVRPWSAQHFLAALPDSTRRICVIDQCRNGDTPLFKDVTSSFHSGEAQYATPLLVSATLAPHAALGYHPGLVAAIEENLTSASPRARFSHADVESAMEKVPFSEVSSLVNQMVSWTLRKNGAAARNALAAVCGPVMGLKVQAVEQASAQSGVARTELRFSTIALRNFEHTIRGADVVVVDDPSVLLLPNCDVLAQARQGTRLLINAPWTSIEQVARELTPAFRANLVASGVELFVANGTKIVGDAPAMSNWAMQLLGVHLLGSKADYAQTYTHIARVAAAAVPEAKSTFLPKLKPDCVATAVVRFDLSKVSWKAPAATDADADGSTLPYPRDLVAASLAPSSRVELTSSKSAKQASIPADPATVPYHDLMHQLFGERLLVSDTTGSSVMESVEASYGATLARAHARKRLVDYVKQMLSDRKASQVCSKELLATLGMWHGSHDNAVRCGRVIPRLVGLLAAEKDAHSDVSYVFEHRDLLPKASEWIVAGDNWAQDLAANGIHHLLKSGADVNVVIFDHSDLAAGAAAPAAAETDLNESAVSVAASMTTAPPAVGEQPAQPADSNKRNIGLYAMNYGNAYVASVSALASQSQALRALAEADAYRGPSVILAHAPRPADADGEAQSVLASLDTSFASESATADKTGAASSATAAAAAVDSGAWPLYRWNPNHRDEEFSLDSAKLLKSIEEFLKREQQLSILANAAPANPVVDPEATLESRRATQHDELLRAAQQRRLAAQFDQLADAAAAPAGGNRDLGLLVLFGSDGGNAASVAEKIAKKAEVSGCGEVRCLEANDVTPEDLAEEKHLVMVLATAGQGEPCANSKNLVEALMGSSVKLEELKFAVFGLGDSHYWGKDTADSKKYFCLNAREIDEKLASLGAQRIQPVGLGDDQDEDGYDSALNVWEPALWDALDVTIDTSADLGGAPKIVDDDIKLKSNFLQGMIDEGLRDTTTGKLLPEDTKLTKFHGMYQQDQRELREERIAAKQELAYSFMIRIGLPGGVCTSEQWIAMDDIITKYSGNQILKVTTRQAFQIHGVIKTDLKDTMKAINRATMDTLAACGDVNRNVIGDQNWRKSPGHAEFNDLARALQAHLRPQAGGHSYAQIWLDKQIVAGTVMEEKIYGPTYLPRKFKIALAVNNERNLVDVFSHCLGLIANIKNGKLQDVIVTVGGGMGTTFGQESTYPRLADVLGSVRPDQVLAVAEAIVKVQRDNGERENRKNARLKYTVERMGLEVFKSKVEALCGFRIPKAGPIFFTSNSDKFGWERGYDGMWDYTLFVENGSVRDDPDYKLRTCLYDVAKANLGGEMSLTATQNVVIGKVSPQNKPRIEEILRSYGVSNERFTGMRKSSMACASLPYCALAMAEASRYLPTLLDKMDDIITECGLRNDEIVVRVTGCPNGCARPYMAEIALIGTAPGRYHLLLGGGGAGERIARLVKRGCSEEEILDICRPLFEQYAKYRLNGERFGDFVVRQKVVEPVIHGRCFWVEDAKDNDTNSPSGTNHIYW